MKCFYYNIDDAEFFDPSGEKLPRCVPELFYQERAEWRIFLRDRENRVCDISDVVAWSAAVDCDYRADTAPMCRTTAENISANNTTGMVTVLLDAATAEFLAAVDGVQKRRAFFELYGLNAAGDRELHIEFEISARMVIDPAPGVPQEVPETFATRDYVELAVSGAAASAVSGAIFSGAEIVTSVGGYTVALTSGGGVVVSGSGAAVTLSGGAIVASADDGNDWANIGTVLSMTSGGGVTVSAYNVAAGGGKEYLLAVDHNGITASGGSGESVVLAGGTVNLHLEDGDGEHQDVTLDTNGVHITAAGADRKVVLSQGGYECEVGDSGVLVNSLPVLTELVTSTDSTTTSASFEELAGGTAYVYTQPLTALDIASVTSGCRAMFKFTAGADFQLGLSGGAELVGSSSCDSGTRYVVAIGEGMAVVNSITIAGA